VGTTKSTLPPNLDSLHGCVLHRETSSPAHSSFPRFIDPISYPGRCGHRFRFTSGISTRLHQKVGTLPRPKDPTSLPTPAPTLKVNCKKCLTGRLDRGMALAGWTQFTLSRRFKQRDKVRKYGPAATLRGTAPGFVSITRLKRRQLLYGATFRSGSVTVPMDRSATTTFTAASLTVVSSPLNGFQQGSFDASLRTFRDGRAPGWSHILSEHASFCLTLDSPFGFWLCVLHAQHAPARAISSRQKVDGG
jgi:hypothetical protein